ncbi:hypothetical protein [Sphingobium bisphenolivorans]|uniref:hypothetical protein n=1 Tax=Sphingobium bisphenolivorans TaxID=1335760 RepID=UPI0003A750E9|nr:hypothetical protein [Sphingobium bisphenolivorans]
MTTGVENEDVGGLPALLSAYAGEQRERHRLIWALDARFARLAATTSDAMIGALRLAWWNNALTDESGVKGRGEPLIDAMRLAGALPVAGLDQWLDGWEAMTGEIDLVAYAEGRGGGLFRALASRADIPDWLASAGAAWALWDLSGHTGNAELVGEALALARRHLIGQEVRWPREWRPLRIAYQLARDDIVRSRHAPAGLTPGLYLKLIRIALTGR